jgi:tetratricopeptide (TPR) repeat protein
MYKEAILYERLGKFTQSLTLLSHGMSQLDGLTGRSPAAVRAMLATRYGFGRTLQGRAKDAIKWGELAVAEASRARDKAALATAYNALQIAYLYSGREPDRPYGLLAMRTCEEIGDLPGQGHAANTLAIAAHGAGRWDEAEQLFAQAADIFGRIGDITSESNAIYNRADLLVRQRRYAEARPVLREVIDTARAVGDEELVSLALRELARACAGMGNAAEADEFFDEAHERLTALGLRHELVTFEAARAEAALLRGDPEQALRLLDSATARASELGGSEATQWLHRLEANALLEIGLTDDAANAVESGLAADGDDGGYERAMLLLAAARVAGRRGEQAGSLHDEGARVLRTLGVVGHPDSLAPAAVG